MTISLDGTQLMAQLTGQGPWVLLLTLSLSPAPPELMVGTATMDSSCTKVAFQAASNPAVFAAGTQALAVQLTGTFPAVSLTGGTVCRTGGLAMMKCNQYAIMEGRR
jgi:hypothetical protein